MLMLKPGKLRNIDRLSFTPPQRAQSQVKARVVAHYIAFDKRGHKLRSNVVVANGEGTGLDYGDQRLGGAKPDAADLSQLGTCVSLCQLFVEGFDYRQGAGSSTAGSRA